MNVYLDAKTASLKEKLKECIYMQQPKGYIPKGQEHLVCLLNRGILGLKQGTYI